MCTLEFSRTQDTKLDTNSSVQSIQPPKNYHAEIVHNPHMSNIVNPAPRRTADFPSRFDTRVSCDLPIPPFDLSQSIPYTRYLPPMAIPKVEDEPSRKMMYTPMLPSFSQFLYQTGMPN